MVLDNLRIDRLINVTNKTQNNIKVKKFSLSKRKSSDKINICPTIGTKVSSGTPPGKGLYFNIYPSSCHDMDTALTVGGPRPVGRLDFWKLVHPKTVKWLDRFPLCLILQKNHKKIIQTLDNCWLLIYTTGRFKETVSCNMSLTYRKTHTQH